jgi:RNA polymerase sigma factor (sigma-70 family)
VGVSPQGVRRDDAEDLWRRFGAGDRAAFATLYRDHQRDVYRYCQSLLHHEEDAHDAAQGTWTAIWTTPEAARREVPLRPWLFRVAHNEAVDILRRRRPHDQLAGHDVPALSDVEGDVERRDRLATLRADLGHLPQRQRAALLLREVGGLGHAEIGAVFDISPGAAKQTIYEARQALAEAEGGRSMDCGLVRCAIAAGDGRVRRGRRLRAHLRGCASCRAFAAGLDRRGDDLKGLVPALPVPAAVGLLLHVVGKVAVALVVAAAGAGGHHAIARPVVLTPTARPRAPHPAAAAHRRQVGPADRA